MDDTPPPPHLDDELDRLSLVNEAIWVLVSRRLGLADADLRTAVDELRAARRRDGGDRPRPCPACGSMVPTGRPSCQFCGAAAPTGPPIA